ncbi:hypothetical protein IFM89_003350 [Coptis chinensis]|uniref:Uncharacterized protein n=1 Tax=Coptis chinensis TaxID=261450 RepID=A0A835M8U1_9MAGN|nr:hypothetical protein IFM89_003350 [Coptis chinensis]
MASSIPSSSLDQIHFSNSPNPTQSCVITREDKLEPEDIMPDIWDSFQDMNTEEDNQRYEKYYADYTRYLKAKYFSGKNLYGGNIYEKEVTIDDMTLKASRWPCTRSFTDPIKSFEDHSKLSASTIKAPSSVPSRKKSSN